ncbi:hypothetical protein ACFV0Y_24180 [Streptomyces sp. NPDC059569]|uniref:hypothetical protein n=1 Tax=Streptomyces sp. NPDC059569 TaxID=3346869 RepID=UPI003676187A
MIGMVWWRWWAVFVVLWAASVSLGMHLLFGEAWPDTVARFLTMAITAAVVLGGIGLVRRRRAERGMAAGQTRSASFVRRRRQSDGAPHSDPAP